MAFQLDFREHCAQNNHPSLPLYKSKDWRGRNSSTGKRFYSGQHMSNAERDSRAELGRLGVHVWGGVGNYKQQIVTTLNRDVR